MPPIPREELLLPDFLQDQCSKQFTGADILSGSQVSTWLETRMERMRAAWAERLPESSAAARIKPEFCAEQIIEVLLHRKFTHQSRGRVSPLFDGLRRGLLRHITSGRRITYFLLYNGGYRASPIPGTLGLNFHPDQTELNLLYQITLLRQRIAEIGFEPTGTGPDALRMIQVTPNMVSA